MAAWLSVCTVHAGDCVEYFYEVQPAPENLEALAQAIAFESSSFRHIGPSEEARAFAADVLQRGYLPANQELSKNLPKGRFRYAQSRRGPIYMVFVSTDGQFASDKKLSDFDEQLWDLNTSGVFYSNVEGQNLTGLRRAALATAFIAVADLLIGGVATWIYASPVVLATTWRFLRYWKSTESREYADLIRDLLAFVLYHQDYRKRVLLILRHPGDAELLMSLLRHEISEVASPDFLVGGCYSDFEAASHERDYEALHRQLLGREPPRY